MGRMMHRSPHVSEKKKRTCRLYQQMTHSFILRIRPLWWPEKQSFFFLLKKSFSTHFDPKNLENTTETLLNQLKAT